MATANTNLAVQEEVKVNPTATEDVSFEQSTFVVITRIEKKTEKGEETEYKVAKVVGEEQLEAYVKEGWKAEWTQSVAYPKALNVKGIEALSPDAEETVAMFNRGNKIKIDNKLRAELTKLDDNGELEFSPVEGALDLSSYSLEKTQARGLTPAERMLKVLSKEIAKIKTEGEAVEFATMLNMPSAMIIEEWKKAKHA